MFNNKTGYEYYNLMLPDRFQINDRLPQNYFAVYLSALLSSSSWSLNNKMYSVVLPYL